MSIKDFIKKVLVKVGMTNPHPYTQSVRREIRECRRSVEQLRYTLFAMRYRKPEKPEEHFKQCVLLHCCTAAGWGVNMGDYVQAISVKRAVSGILPEVGFTYHERDYLSDYAGGKAFVVMQGWFAKDADFMPNGLLCPVYVGMHIAEPSRDAFLDFLRMNPGYFQGHDVGCRDMDTVHFLQGLGVSAYLSRCLTLTLPKREKAPENGKVFIVNVPPPMLDKIPAELRKDAVLVNQRRRRDYGDTVLELVPQFDRFMEDTEELLARYRDEARLVITTAIHCASPCTGMGIPTVLIDAGNERGKRLGFLQGIIPIYTPEDLAAGKVEWEADAPDVTELQEKILLNLRLSIMKEKGESVDAGQLAEVRRFIAGFHASGTPDGAVSGKA